MKNNRNQYAIFKSINMKKAIFEFIKGKGWEPIYNKRISKEEINKMVSISNRIVRLEKKERKMKMPIKIFTEKLIVDGKKCRMVVAWEGFLRLNDLPHNYLTSNEPAFFATHYSILNKSIDPVDKSTRILLIRCKDEQPFLKTKPYPENEFQSILSYIRKAGENLQRINQKLKLEQWKGKEEFII